MNDDAYTYSRGKDGVYDTFTISHREKTEVARLHFWDKRAGEATKAEKSAKIICAHLNRWYIGIDW